MCLQKIVYKKLKHRVSPSASKELSSDFKSMIWYLLSGLQLPN